jgi:hypothetical protein
LPYTPSEFRRTFPALVHYAPQGVLRIDRGLLTAAQVLDQNADGDRNVWAKFQGEAEFRPWAVDHWKTHSRFRRRAGASGSNILVRDVAAKTAVYFLGNNYPLGDGTCLGTSIALSDNRTAALTPSRADWFRILNDMFWVFGAKHINRGVLDHLRTASSSMQLSRIVVPTANLSDEFVENHIRLSAINGGGSNGGFPRGTATYKRPSEWAGTKTPKEIGILHGISATLAREIALRVEDG